MIDVSWYILFNNYIKPQPVWGIDIDTIVPTKGILLITKPSLCTNKLCL